MSYYQQPTSKGNVRRVRTNRIQQAINLNGASGVTRQQRKTIKDASVRTIRQFNIRTVFNEDLRNSVMRF